MDTVIKLNLSQSVELNWAMVGIIELITKINLQNIFMFLKREVLIITHRTKMDLYTIKVKMAPEMVPLLK